MIAFLHNNNSKQNWVVTADFNHLCICAVILIHNTIFDYIRTATYGLAYCECIGFCNISYCTLHGRIKAMPLTVLSIQY